MPSASIGSSPTAFPDHRTEQPPDDPYTGPSIFDLSASPKYGRFNYEGGNVLWEIADAPSDFMTNAESISKLIHSYNVYGLGGRMTDYARSGCIPGVATWAESLSNSVDVALLFNARPCLDFPSSVIVNLRDALAGL